MKNLKITILVMLMFCAQNFKSQNILSPENVFHLYFNSFVNFDDDSLKELNSYVINFLGKDNTHKMNLEDAYNQKVDNLTQVFLSNLPADVSSKCKTEAHDYFDVLMNNFRSGTYKVKTIKSVTNPELKDQEITEVTYEISFKVPSNLASLNMGDIKKIGGGEMKKHLIEAANQLKRADKTVTAEQKFNLYQVKNGSDTYYWNGGPQELLWKATEFYFRNLN